MPNLNECYRTLELRVGASLEDVNQAYKDLVFIWHPDRIPKSRERLQERAIVKLQELNEAREYLQAYHQRRQNLRSARRPAQRAAAAGQTQAANQQPSKTSTTKRKASKRLRPPKPASLKRQRTFGSAQRLHSLVLVLFLRLKRRLLRQHPQVSLPLTNNLLSKLLRPSEPLNDGKRGELLQHLNQQLILRPNTLVQRQRLGPPLQIIVG